MSDDIPTVTIETVNGPVLINHFDFDPAIHVLHASSAPLPASLAPVEPVAGSDPAATIVPPAVGEAKAPAGALYVVNEGDKFYLTDSFGKHVRRKGFDSEAEAYAAMVQPE